MTSITDQGALAWRDYVTDGVPSSGARKTPKADARAVMAAIDSQKMEVVETLAALKAMTTRPGAVLVKGKTTAHDGWGGVFLWNAGSSTTADDAMTVTCTSGTAGRYKRLHDAGLVNARWFGAGIGELEIDARPGIQAAIDWLTVGPGLQNLFGGTVYLPAGVSAVTTSSQPIKMTRGVKLLGAGIGAADGSGNSGGTIIRCTTAGGDVVVIESAAGGQIQDLSIDAPGVTKSSGTALVRVRGAGGAGTVNDRARLLNLRLLNGYDGVVLDSASNFEMAHCYVVDYINYGVYFKQSNNVDGGQNKIIGGTIQDLNVLTSKANVCYEQGGDTHITGGVKLIGGEHGVLIDLKDGPTATFTLSGGFSVEEHTKYGFRVQQATSGKNFGNIVIAGGQFSDIETAPLGTISFAAGTAAGGDPTSWLKNISIGNIVINNTHNEAVYMIDIQDGWAITLDNIAANSGASMTNPLGINIAGNAATVGKVKIGPAIQFINMPDANKFSTGSHKFREKSAQVILSSGSTSLAAGQTRYVGLADLFSSEGDALFYNSRKARALTFRSCGGAGPGTGETNTYTLRVNGSDTTATWQVTGGPSDGEDTTHTVLIPGGLDVAARWSLKVVASNNGSYAGGTHRVSWELIYED